VARTYRLLHLSDFHVAGASLSGAFGREFLESFGPGNLFGLFARPASRTKLMAVAEVAYRLKPLDAILITGDLANRGDRTSLQAALAIVERAAGSAWKGHDGQPTLQAAGAKIYLLPGNHDRYDQTLGFSGAGGRDFDEVFKTYWNVGQGVSSIHLDGELGVVFGDLTLARVGDAQGPGASWGQGRAYPERVAFMELETKHLKAKHAGIAILWAVHFAPRFERLDHSLRLLEEDRLLEAAQRQGIRHLLCGHTHVARHYFTANPRLEILCTGTAAQAGNPSNTIHLIEIETKKGSIHRFEPSALDFIPKEGRFLPKP
jgi:3',5'-cyclic AMP phosphodiesterase CpdA